MFKLFTGVQGYLIMGGLLLSIITGTFFFGFSHGKKYAYAKTEQARLETQDELFDLGEVVAKQAAKLETLKTEKEELNYELETLAANDSPGIGPDGMRRLERRWSTP